MNKVDMKRHEIPAFDVTERDILTVKKVDKVPVREK